MRRTLWILGLLTAAAASTPVFAQKGGGGGRPPGNQPETPSGQPEDEKDVKDKQPTKFALGERAPDPNAESWVNTPESGSTAPTLSRYRGRLVAYYFFRTDGTAADTIPDVLAVAKKFSKQVVFIGFTPQARDQAEPVIKAKKITFMVGCGAKMEEKYSLAAPPCVYLMDTRGRFVGRFHPSEDLEARIQAQIEKTPPAGSDSQEIKNRKRQAETAFQEKQLGKAYSIARELSKVVDKESSDGKSIAELMKRLEQAGQKLLDEAKEKASGNDADAALKTLAELRVCFEGVTVGANAEGELGRLMGDNRLKSKVRKAIENAKGEQLNDLAADSEASRRYLEALNTYRQVMEEYADTAAAKAAEAAIDRIGSDAEAQKLMQSIWADEEAERWLGLADGYAKIELYDKARELYTKIIEAHPEARATARAKERLAKLPAEKPDADASVDVKGAADKPSGKGPTEAGRPAGAGKAGETEKGSQGKESGGAGAKQAPS